jgi:hypothetical protein
MHGRRKLFSFTLLVEVEGRLIKYWFAIYALVSM